MHDSYTALFWLIQIIYAANFIPQIWLNYRLKSLRGLSDLYLMAFLCAYIGELFYFYCLDFPTAYKAMIFVFLAEILFMTYQRFLYGGTTPKKYLAFGYGIIALITAIIFPYAFTHPQIVGHSAGWFMVSIWSVYQIPQIIKNHARKSVKGFSFISATLIAMGALLELSLAFITHLPIQTIFKTSRSILVYLIFCFQFWLYVNPENHTPNSS